jgi:hypothetical protein
LFNDVGLFQYSYSWIDCLGSCIEQNSDKYPFMSVKCDIYDVFAYSCRRMAVFLRIRSNMVGITLYNGKFEVLRWV